jgi:hypothetical protein
MRRSASSARGLQALFSTESLFGISVQKGIAFQVSALQVTFGHMIDNV